jgi:hypothetical protein
MVYNMMKDVPLYHTSPMMNVERNQHMVVPMISTLAAQKDNMELLYKTPPFANPEF